MMQRQIDKEQLNPDQLHKLFMFSVIVSLFGIGITLRQDLVEAFSESFYSAYSNVHMETVERYFKQQQELDQEFVLANSDCVGSA